MGFDVQDVFEQIGHFAFLGGLTGFFAGWAGKKLGASRGLVIAIGALTATVIGGVREFFQNFVQWEGEPFFSKFRVEPDEENNYLDLALDMLFTILGGVAAGFGVNAFIKT